MIWKFRSGIPVLAQWKWVWWISMRMPVWSPACLSGSGIRDAVSCGVGHRSGSSPTLLWLCHQPAHTHTHTPKKKKIIISGQLFTYNIGKEMRWEKISIEEYKENCLHWNKHICENKAWERERPMAKRRKYILEALVGYTVIISSFVYFLCT